ncbi:nicotinate phosphoribosyltransferase [Pseudozyma hubeiensis SY62]|uniref:Nicotinate phosphoribosyltransferase n=1 Tax=Pseudozyma hubeiensis (strain SY62) TaxID=1305764 RepID=R9P2T5_PSEHS|nr:nicotinate phosphoribosyltransferase [Pseudozyma hubeiensis SY62]GAC95651.1 nicotinate phosphoribosyltransferase [Pseudozyma hubeiensis SY62]
MNGNERRQRQLEKDGLQQSGSSGKRQGWSGSVAELRNTIFPTTYSDVQQVWTRASSDANENPSTPSLRETEEGMRQMKPLKKTQGESECL